VKVTESLSNAPVQHVLKRALMDAWFLELQGSPMNEQRAGIRPWKIHAVLAEDKAMGLGHAKSSQ
jgi:hypothetical protein